MISPSGTPFHLAIALQPSTQSWRVIWVRAGIALIAGSPNPSFRSTRPAISSFQSAQLFAAPARYSSVIGGGLPLGLKYRDMSFSANSCARAFLPARKRSRRRLTPSTDSSTDRTSWFCCSRLKNPSQPASPTNPTPWSAPASTRRRDRKFLFCVIFFLRFFFSRRFSRRRFDGRLRFRGSERRCFRHRLGRDFFVRHRCLRRSPDRRDFLDIPTGDDRAHIVDDARCHHHEDVSKSKTHKKPGRYKVHRPRRLAPAEHRRQPMEADVHLRRHRQPRKNRQRNEDKEDAGISTFLQGIVFSLLRRFAAQAQIIERHRRDPRHVARAQKKFAQVAFPEAVSQVQQTIEDEHPGEKKVPPAAASQPEVTGNRCPARKRAWKRPRLRILDPEPPCRVDTPSEQPRIAANFSTLVGSVD